MIRANTVYSFYGWTFKIEPIIGTSESTFKVKYQKGTDAANDWNIVIVDADDPRDALMKGIANIRARLKENSRTLKQVWMDVNEYGEDQECLYEIRDGITMSVTYEFSDYYNPFQCGIVFRCDTEEDAVLMHLAAGANKRDAFIKAFKGILSKGDIVNIYALDLLNGATMALTDLETDGQ